MKALWDDITDMLKAPFVGDLDLVHLFLLTGVVLLFIAAWVLIINHVKLAATEVL